jgi:hypothetical protein
VEFDEWLCRKVVKDIPHRHVMFNVPKIIICYFLYDRKLLSELSRFGWEALKAIYTADDHDTRVIPYAAIAIHAFGALLGYHPTSIFWS